MLLGIAMVFCGTIGGFILAGLLGAAKCGDAIQERSRCAVILQARISYHRRFESSAAIRRELEAALNEILNHEL